MFCDWSGGRIKIDFSLWSVTRQDIHWEWGKPEDGQPASWAKRHLENILPPIFSPICVVTYKERHREEPRNLEKEKGRSKEEMKGGSKERRSERWHIASPVLRLPLPAWDWKAFLWPPWEQGPPGNPWFIDTRCWSGWEETPRTRWFQQMYIFGSASSTQDRSCQPPLNTSKNLLPLDVKYTFWSDWSLILNSTQPTPLTCTISGLGLIGCFQMLFFRHLRLSKISKSLKATWHEGLSLASLIYCWPT